MRHTIRSNLKNHSNRSKFTAKLKEEGLGQPSGILDRDGNEIITGDFVMIGDNYWDSGLFSYNSFFGCYGIHYGCWYNGRNIYDPSCYGKFSSIPSDNGMRMELKKVQPEECRDAKCMEFIVH